MGMPPSGKKVTMKGVGIYKIQRGKVLELWTFADFLGVMTQLGAIPSAAKK